MSASNAKILDVFQITDDDGHPSADYVHGMLIVPRDGRCISCDRVLLDPSSCLRHRQRPPNQAHLYRAFQDAGGHPSGTVVTIKRSDFASQALHNALYLSCGLQVAQDLPQVSATLSDYFTDVYLFMCGHCANTFYSERERMVADEQERQRDAIRVEKLFSGPGIEAIVRGEVDLEEPEVQGTELDID